MFENTDWPTFVVGAVAALASLIAAAAAVKSVVIQRRAISREPEPSIVIGTDYDAKNDEARIYVTAIQNGNVPWKGNSLTLLSPKISKVISERETQAGRNYNPNLGAYEGGKSAAELATSNSVEARFSTRASSKHPEAKGSETYIIPNASRVFSKSRIGQLELSLEALNMESQKMRARHTFEVGIEE